MSKSPARLLSERLNTGLTGPVSATLGNIIIFDNVSGKIVADSGIGLSNILLDSDVGTNVLGYSATVSYTDQTQIWSSPQRVSPITENSGSFNLNSSHDFICTASGPITLEFTNLVSGQKGSILFENVGANAVTLSSEIETSASAAADLSVAGKYRIDYWSYNGTNVQISYSEALV